MDRPLAAEQWWVKEGVATPCRNIFMLKTGPAVSYGAATGPPQPIMCFYNYTLTWCVLFQERGTCPLHMAAQAGQTSQVELLVVYGADAGGFDANGRTPVEHARLVVITGT